MIDEIVHPAGKPDVVKLDVVVEPKVTFELDAVTEPAIPVIVTAVAFVLLGGPVVLPVTELAARVKIT